MIQQVTNTVLLPNISNFVLIALAILALVANIFLGILIYRWGTRRLFNSVGYNYMDSYKNANFDEVEQAIYRSNGNNSSQW